MTDRLDDERLAELERLAGEATPGPWEQFRGDTVVGGDGFAVASTYFECARRDEEADANAAYLAAVDPDTVRALVAEVRALRQHARDVIEAHGCLCAARAIGANEHSRYCPEAADGR